MTGGVAVGLALALGSAAALSWGFIAQHGAAASLPPLTLRRPLHSLALLLRARRWLLGFVVGLSGWALYVGALALAPLALVQGASAGGIALMAALVGRLTELERAAVALAVAGLLLLAVSLIGAGAPTGHGHAGAVAVWIAASVAVAALAAGPGGRLLAGGAGLGVAAGMASLWTNALPIAAGTFLFGETLPHGARGAARLAAFVLLVAGAALLSRPASEELTDQSVNSTLRRRWSRSSNRLPAASRLR